MKDKKLVIAIPIIIVIILIAAIFLIGIPMYLNYSARKELAETLVTNTDENRIETETMMTQLEEQEKEIFNQSFMSYETEEGNTTPASTVLSLFSTICNSNEENSDRLIDVNGIVITNENLEPLKGVISNDTEYNIKCIFGEDGYVKTIELRYE